MRYAVRLHFPALNNLAEYEALLSGLKIAIEIGVKRLDVRGDSQLVNDQVMKNASCHDNKMEAYCKAVRVRTMCGSRTGGWSLPCVMSD
jgi:ribonuclease HI